MKPSYLKFLLMILVSGVIMYRVMYANVADISHIYHGTMRVYMTLLMIGPMAVVMMLFMRSMYPQQRYNTLIVLTGIVITLGAFWGLRSQWGISDAAWMKAMIPHHSSAILTSTYANLQDPAVQQLADEIIIAQQEEIALMKQLLQK